MTHFESRHLASLGTCAALLMSTSALGQWSEEGGDNVLVSGLASRAAVAHAVAAPDGSTWIAWYDAAGGYDIEIQRLDAGGHRIFPTSIEVADQSLSWVQDFDLTCDANGNAAVAWADGEKARAVMISPIGLTLYDHTFEGGGYYANAQICADTNGTTVVGFAVEDTSHFHRLRPDGKFVWAEAVEVGGTGFTIVSDLKPSDNGSVLASFVHYLTFSGAKRLKAQRISSFGSLPWGDAAKDVFTSGSLQYGGFPEFISDGQGGGIFTWYTTANLMSHVQWVDAGGQCLLGNNGLSVTTESSMVHVSPSAALDEATGDATIFWVRQNAAQSTAGLQANRVTRGGERLWGHSGMTMVPPTSAFSIIDLHAGSMGDVACATWLRSTVAGVASVLAIGVDDQGDSAWNDDPTPLAWGDHAAIDRTSLTRAMHSGQMVTAWTDERMGGSHLFAQNIRDDGQVGPDDPCLGDLSGDEIVGVADLLRVLDAWGPCSECEEDLTGDGHVGVTDLLVILDAWGPC